MPPEKINGRAALAALPMDVPELEDVLHQWFDGGGAADTLRATVEAVIGERDEPHADAESFTDRHKGAAH